MLPLDPRPRKTEPTVAGCDVPGLVTCKTAERSWRSAAANDALDFDGYWRACTSKLFTGSVANTTSFGMPAEVHPVGRSIMI